MGRVIEQAQEISLTVNDDASAEIATNLGVAIKTKLEWLKKRREDVYEPLYHATENVRREYDDPIKLGKQLEKTLSASVIKYKLDKKREEDRLRLAAEADARRIREEAAEKARLAEAERQRIIKEQERREQERRDQIAAEERRKAAEAEAKRKAAQEREQREADERARLIKQEEDERIRKAQEASDVGLGERVESILERPTAIAPIAKPLPTAAAVAEEAERRRLEDEAEAKAEAERKAAAEREDSLREEEAARMRQLQDEAARAKADADAAESMAASQVIVPGVDGRMRTSGRWQYTVRDKKDFLKLAMAVAEERLPVEWLNFNPESPEKFKATAIGKYVTKLKEDIDRSGKQATLAAVGITCWLEEGGSFIVESE
jgi:hypothetical protein